METQEEMAPKKASPSMVPLTVRVPPSFEEQLVKMADEREVSISALLRNLIDRGYAELCQDAAKTLDYQNKLLINAKLMAEAIKQGAEQR